MNKLRILLLVLVSGIASAGAVKVWSNGEYITATDLNAVIAHLHANLGHGHGSIIINSDINASAGIAHTKLASPQLVPKAFGNYTISGSACSAGDSSGFTSCTYTSAGVYVVNLTARANSNFTVLVSSNSTTADLDCHGWAATTSTIAIRCITASTGAAAESNFNLILMDTDN